jgi:hypothetical protein
MSKPEQKRFITCGAHHSDSEDLVPPICSYERGHNRVRGHPNPEGDPTLWDHGNPSSGVWWNVTPAVKTSNPALEKVREIISKTSGHVNGDGIRVTAEELERILVEAFEAGAENAAFEHQMTVMAYHFAQAITKTGPGIVADRLGIDLEELERRIKPSVFAELTMSELRLLSLCAEVEVSYAVIPMPREEGEDVSR